MIDRRHGWNVSFKPLYLGFILSIILVLAAYRIATYYHLTNWHLTLTLFVFAILQMLIQLVFFLHLGLGESKPHWNVISFLFMVLVIVVVIGGSLWIMYNLNYNLMPVGGY